MGLRLKKVSFTQGQAWLRAGLRTFVRHPMGFVALFTGYLLLSLLLGVVPLVGPVLAASSIPLLSLVFMIATREVQQGRPVRPALLFAWWQDGPLQRRRVLMLCLGYGLLVTLVVVAAFQEGGDALAAALKPLGTASGNTQDLMSVISHPAVNRLVNWITLGVALVSVPWWHALALVRWGGQSPAQALFSSTLALWRTRGALLVYGLSWLGFTLLGSLAASLLSLLLSLVGGAALALVPGLMMMLALSSAFYISLWFMFEDSFGTDEATGGA